jgi:hypothetical protein
MPPLYWPLVEDLWPGPLTLLLPASPVLAPGVSAGQATVAVRMPSHPLARALIHTAGEDGGSMGHQVCETVRFWSGWRLVMWQLIVCTPAASPVTSAVSHSYLYRVHTCELLAGLWHICHAPAPFSRSCVPALVPGVPLAAPSANISGRPSPTTGDHVMADLSGRIPLVVDGGPAGVGLESTVLDGLRDPPAVLRPGGVTREVLASYPGLSHCGVSPWSPAMCIQQVLNM